MDWISGLLVEQNSLQAVVIILLIIAIGLGFGRMKVAGVSLGVTFVFFCGILAGHLGLRINSQVLQFAQNFGLVIFVYALGLQVGPGFFNSFRKGGVKLNMWGLAVLIAGTLLTILFSFVTNVSLQDMVGIMCGATTNTPALAAAQQTLEQMGIESSSLAIGTAVTYPLGVVGVIIALIVLFKLLGGKNKIQPDEKKENPAFIATYLVSNPAILALWQGEHSSVGHGLGGRRQTACGDLRKRVGGVTHHIWKRRGERLESRRHRLEFHRQFAHFQSDSYNEAAY